MIQIRADGSVVYDSRMDHALEIHATTGTDISGTAEITLPPGSRAYDAFVSYKTVVEILRHEELIFRGRPLYPTDDFYNRRTITCEGERGFLRDGVLRAYSYNTSPAAIFSDVIAKYNAQVDEFKRFVVGEITVTAVSPVLLENDEAEQISDVVDHLVEQLGGHIVFSTNSAGNRVINWYAEINQPNTQTIKFGENLVDFTRSGTDEDPVNTVIPYGAADEQTGERIDIKSVNGGIDYISDTNAVALRGVIARAIYYDDITTPTALLTEARKYLSSSKLAGVSIELSAVDLSTLDVDIRSLRAGDTVRVISAPHGVDDSFQILERGYDLLHPSADTVVLGKQLYTLTGADARGDGNLRRTRKEIRTESSAALAAAKTAIEGTIAQTATTLRAEISASNVLWSGASQLAAADTVNLSGMVSGQKNGIVLVFSAAGQDSGWVSAFVPKGLVSLQPGRLNRFQTSRTSEKLISITDGGLTGSAVNTQSGTDGGIAFDNTATVLRYVIGL